MAQKNINGDLNVAGKISGGEIAETMTGYSFAPSSPENYTFTLHYAGVVKNGNKVTFAVLAEVTKIADNTGDFHPRIGRFTIPAAIGAKLNAVTIGSFGNQLAVVPTIAINDPSTSVKSINMDVIKVDGTHIDLTLLNARVVLDAGVNYLVRGEVTFLLSDNLAA